MATVMNLVLIIVIY